MTVCDAKIELPEPVRRAVAVLDTGVQRHDDTTAQVQDILVLAHAASCVTIALLIRSHYISLSHDEPSGRDHRIAEACRILEEWKPTPPDEESVSVSEQDQKQIMKRLVVAAGCYDADDHLRRIIPDYWY